MKRTILIITLIMTAFCRYGYSGTMTGGVHDTLTATFKVNGNGTCKTAIESVVSTIAGVLSVSWDAVSKNITVKYLTSKVQVSDLHSGLALAGYDTAVLRAKQAAYD